MKLNHNLNGICFEVDTVADINNDLQDRHCILSLIYNIRGHVADINNDWQSFLC